MGFGACLELGESGRLNACVADIDHEAEPLPKVVGTLDHYVEGLEAFRSYVALGCDFGFSAVEVYPYQNFELVSQMFPLPSAAAPLRPPAAPLQPHPSLDSKCDAGNKFLGKPCDLNGCEYPASERAIPARQ